MKTNKDIMNYKLEKFWNSCGKPFLIIAFSMNYKLEKFWNEGMKIFANLLGAMNYKLEKFWNFSKWL